MVAGWNRSDLEAMVQEFPALPKKWVCGATITDIMGVVDFISFNELVAAEGVKRLRMKANHYRFGEQHRILSGRRVGSELRERILIHFQHHDLDDAYCIDLTKVEFLDLSCADELIHGLLDQIRTRSRGPRTVVLAGVNGSVHENITAVLELRQQECLKEIGEKPLGPHGVYAIVLQVAPERVASRQAHERATDDAARLYPGAEGKRSRLLPPPTPELVNTV
jgi:anti-anti-sigma regulatory factor